MTNTYSVTKWLTGLVLLLAVSGGGFYYYHTTQEKVTGSQETVAATRGKIVSSVSATGTIKPVNAVDISSQITALIKEIKVKENDRVKAGQVLAILDDTTYRTAVDKALYEISNVALKSNKNINLLIWPNIVKYRQIIRFYHDYPGY